MFIMTLQHTVYSNSLAGKVYTKDILCITVHKILNSLDSPLSSLVTLHQPAHIYNLRSNSIPLLLQVPFPRIEINSPLFILNRNKREINSPLFILHQSNGITCSTLDIRTKEY